LLSANQTVLPATVGEPLIEFVPSGRRQTIDASQNLSTAIRTNCVPVTAYTDAVFGDQASCPTTGFALSYGSIGIVQIGPAATSSRFHA
jgi:hypothetical protein